MAGVLRVGILRCVSQPAQASTKTLLSTSKALPSVVPACTITGKTYRGKPLERPAPFPYKTKTYGLLRALFDKTTWRFNENSKLIVVDGPVAAGKSDFGKALADELEMLFVPEPTMDRVYVNSYGYDMRKLDADLPRRCRSFDNRNFLQDPSNELTASYQLHMLTMRYEDYVDALAHLLSTGQGVVLERSVYSDLVFLETLYRQGFVSKAFRGYYNQLQWHVMPDLMRPHLVIYLDVPVAEVKNRLKKRNKDGEADSKVFSDDFLKTMESQYKQNFLKTISSHSELLVYDWSNYGEVEVVVEDIERIDFEKYKRQDEKLKDWRFWHEEDWCAQRITYTRDKHLLMNQFNVPTLNVPEILWTAAENTAWVQTWYSAPGTEYAKGFNEKMGDTGLAFKN